MTPLERITERVGRHGDVNDPATTRPLLTLAEFFEGNDVIGSIGANLVPTPTPAEFYDLLKRIAARPEVSDVLVQITQFDAPEEWPYSDTVWIITSASPEKSPSGSMNRCALINALLAGRKATTSSLAIFLLG